MKIYSAGDLDFTIRKSSQPSGASYSATSQWVEERPGRSSPARGAAFGSINNESKNPPGSSPIRAALWCTPYVYKPPLQISYTSTPRALITGQRINTCMEDPAAGKRVRTEYG